MWACYLATTMALCMVAACSGEACRTSPMDVAPFPPQDRPGKDPDRAFGCGERITCGGASYSVEVKNMITVVTESFYGGLLAFQCESRSGDSVITAEKWFESQASRTREAICGDATNVTRAAVRCEWPQQYRPPGDSECSAPETRYWIEAVQVEQNIPEAPQNFVLQWAVDLEVDDRRCGSHLVRFRRQEPGVFDGCLTDFELLYDATANGIEHASLTKRSDCQARGLRAWYAVTSVR